MMNLITSIEILNMKQKDEQKQKKSLIVRLLDLIRFSTTDAPNFKINKAINVVYRHIKQSIKKQTEESTKKSQIDGLVRELLEFKFKMFKMDR